MVQEIPLTRGYVALVDDEDYLFLVRFKWSVLLRKDGGVAAARHGLYVDGRVYNVMMHRLIMAAPEGEAIDHRDGNPLNNQRSNLRFANAKQNAANTRAVAGKEFKGVHRASQRSYLAQIRDGDRTFYLGSYDTPEQAARVYDAARVRMSGEFAWTNFPDIEAWADEIAANVLAGGKPPVRGDGRKSRRKLTNEQVVEIRRRYTAGEANGRELAAEYGVCVAAIYHLLSGRTFSDVGEPVPNERRRELHANRLKQNAGQRSLLLPEQVSEIKRRYSPRIVTAGQLATEYGVTPACIYSIVNGYSHKEVAA